MTRLLASLALGAVMALALSACGTGNFDNFPGSYEKPAGAQPLALSHDDVAGRTLQRITGVGLRWMSFEADGSWHGPNAENRPHGGTWTIDAGRVCVQGSPWYPTPNCYQFYGSGGEIATLVSDAMPGYHQPASLFRTDDPSDGLDRMMPTTAGSLHPFPARTAKIFFSPSELAGWRIELSNGEWYEFQGGGRVVHGQGAGDGSNGTWQINEYGDVGIKIGSFSKLAYWDLLGSKETGIAGMRSYDRPFEYIPVTSRRVR